MTLADQVAMPLKNYQKGNHLERRARVASLFARVGLPDDLMARYPHEASGGQRQRVSIARALALNPAVIVADEAVSSLDTQTKAVVLELMQQLQRDLGLAYLFISHDMADVRRMSHRIAVMYRGRIVEHGDSAAVLGNPRHSYTKKLLSAVLSADPQRRKAFQSQIQVPEKAPIYAMDHDVEPSVYMEVNQRHFVMVGDPGA